MTSPTKSCCTPVRVCILLALALFFGGFLFESTWVYVSQPLNLTRKWAVSFANSSSLEAPRYDDASGSDADSQEETLRVADSAGGAQEDEMAAVAMEPVVATPTKAVTVESKASIDEVDKLAQAMVSHPAVSQQAAPDSDPSKKSSAAASSGVKRLKFFIFTHKSSHCRREDCGDLSRQPQPMTNRYCSPTYIGAGSYKHHYFYFVHAALLSSHLQARTGIKMEPTQDIFDADLVVCGVREYQIYHTAVQEKGIKKVQHFAILEQFDGASIYTPFSIARDPLVVAILKTTAWRSRGGKCESKEYPKGLQRGARLMELASKSGLPAGQLSAPTIDALIEKTTVCEPANDPVVRSKVKLAIPYQTTVRKFSDVNKGCKDRMEGCPTPIRKRSVDVAFVGNAHPGTPTFWHRNLVIDTLLAFKAKYPKYRVHVGRGKSAKVPGGWGGYIKFLKDLKILVSPWGFGEWSIKDEEAMIAGAIVVKPGASWLDAATLIYRPNETMLEARLDWKDLESVLVSALSNPSWLEQLQNKAHSVVKSFHSYGHAVREKHILESYSEVVTQAAAR